MDHVTAIQVKYTMEKMLDKLSVLHTNFNRRLRRQTAPNSLSKKLKKHFSSFDKSPKMACVRTAMYEIQHVNNCHVHRRSRL